MIDFTQPSDGPWELGESNDEGVCRIFDANGNLIAVVDSHRADAMLLKIAREMWDAMKEIAFGEPDAEAMQAMAREVLGKR